MTRCVAVSYNIHRCIGRDGRNDPERVARVIEELDPDVVGLQEVESRFGGTLDMHQLNYLAEETGFLAVAGSTVLREDSHYGNALLTPHGVREVRTHDVSVPGREPRGVLDVDLDVHGRRLRVLVTHLGLGSRERRRQTRLLLDTVAAHPDEPVVILSDFNEWFPGASRCAGCTLVSGGCRRRTRSPRSARSWRSTASGLRRSATSSRSACTSRRSRAWPPITCRCGRRCGLTCEVRPSPAANPRSAPSGETIGSAGLRGLAAAPGKAPAVCWKTPSMAVFTSQRAGDPGPSSGSAGETGTKR